MQFQIRQMQQNDAEKMQEVYQRFVSDYVGPLTRDSKFLRRMARRKDDLRWVALDENAEIAGYILASYIGGRRLGRINEVIVDPKYNFEAIADSLVDKVYNILVKKGAAVIWATSMRNPCYSRIFPRLGFFGMNTAGVFMLTVTNVPKFLDEIKPVIASRLRRVQSWDGCLQITCEEDSIFFNKQGADVQSVIWTNHDVDFRILLEANVLSSLLLGAVDTEDAWTKGKIRVETTLPEDKTKELLNILFPKKQFLAFSYW